MKQTTNYQIHGGPLFDGRKWIPRGSILFNESGIQEVGEDTGDCGAENTCDVEGAYIIPGLVDLHSDAIEKCIEMRPGIVFDPEFALRSLDRRLAAFGITTFCHAISFGDESLGLRSIDSAFKLVDLIHHHQNGNHTLVNHKIHLRCELGSEHIMEQVKQIISESKADMVSIMDHTPGQGQFRSMESFRKFYSKNYHLSEQEISELVHQKKARHVKAWSQLEEFARFVNQKNLPLVSHDDDTALKINLLFNMGVGGSEFPVSMDAAVAAKEHHMKVFMGAPNLLRGKSSNGHLSAWDTILAGICEGLLSDYYPECLIQAPFFIHKIHHYDLAQGLRLVTSGPGSYLSPTEHLGELRPGGPAAIVVVSNRNIWAEIHQTWCNGRLVYRCGIM